MREVEQSDLDGGVARLDATAFARLFEQSWRMLWTIGVAVLGSRDEVEDVLQESAMIALSKLDDFDPSTSFTAWMGQIVRYTALNTGRRRHRRSARREGGHDMLEQTASPERPAEPHWSPSIAQCVSADQLGIDDQLLASLGRLGETQRACLLLRVVQGLSYRDIATVMSVPEGTAMSHVHRAQKSMRETLSDLHAGADAGADDGGSPR
jgi:RNA polymerase sigma-70 factor (ECF subfamily)